MTERTPTAEALEKAKALVREWENQAILALGEGKQAVKLPVFLALALEDFAAQAVKEETKRCANLAEDPPVLAFGPVSDPQKRAMEKLDSDEFGALISTWGEFVSSAILQDDPVLRRG